MPIYEFRCLKCGDVFESLCLKSSDENQVTCPSCGEARTERVLSTFSSGSRGSKGSDSGMGSSCASVGGFS